MAYDKEVDVLSSTSLFYLAIYNIRAYFVTLK